MPIRTQEHLWGCRMTLLNYIKVELIVFENSNFPLKGQEEKTRLHKCYKKAQFFLLSKKIKSSQLLSSIDV